MKRRHPYLWNAKKTLVAAVGLFLLVGTAFSEETKVAWKTPSSEDVRSQVAAWLDAAKIEPEMRRRVEAVWRDLPGDASEDELLVRMVQSYAMIHADAAKLVSQCSQPRSQFIVPEQRWLVDGGVPALFAGNLRLYYARWLVHESLFDEAQEQLADLTPRDVVAPASLLFYQSVVAHALLNKESGIKTLKELIEGADGSPRRYIALGRLMQSDLEELKDDTLDHVARRMEDIRRRLDLGRAGPKVRTVEDGVIESLDKMIDKLEEQQQQQQQSAAGSGSIRSSNPAPDSRPMGGKGPGEVTKKDIGHESGWGDLPPKERDEAMQQIGRDFPSHYRDAIEQYYRRLASEGKE